MSIKVWHIAVTYILMLFIFAVISLFISLKNNDHISGSNIGNNKSYTITLYKEPSKLTQPKTHETVQKTPEPKINKKSSEDLIPEPIKSKMPTKQKNDTKAPKDNAKKNDGDIKNTKNLKLVKGSQKEGLGGSSERSPEYIESVLMYLQRYRYYPPLALRRHITGTVKVALVINCDGSLNDYEILTSSGKDILDESVKSMLTKTNNFPIEDACISPVAITVPIEFRMA